MIKLNAPKSLPWFKWAMSFVLVTCVHAQNAPKESPEAAYRKVVTDRAAKIVATLKLSDEAKSLKVRDIIADQYVALSTIHDARDAAIKIAKQESREDKATTDTAIEKARSEAQAKLDKFHAAYLAKLSAELTPEQVDGVKDGMTYGVVQVTYNVYLKMMPDLSDEQKKQIMNWLVEAREIAMDQGSSDEKHKVFGKYKGKINNYLSAAGYNLKEAEKNLRK